MEDIETCYDVLKVPESASLDEIKSAYRRLVQQYHPDKTRLQEDLTELRKIAAERFHRIQESYELLSDPIRRRQYDEKLAELRRAHRTDTDAYNSSAAPQAAASSPPASSSQSSSHQGSTASSHTQQRSPGHGVAFQFLRSFTKVLVSLLGGLKSTWAKNPRAAAWTTTIILIASVGSFLLWKTRLDIAVDTGVWRTGSSEIQFLVDDKPFGRGGRISPFSKQLRVESPHFEPAVYSLSEKIRFGRTAAISLKLQRSYGGLELSTDPEEGGFTVDGVDQKPIVGRGNAKYEALPTGKYVVQWKLGPWASGPLEINVERNKVEKIKYSFDAGVAVNSTPQADNIVINSLVLGSTPYATNNAAAGAATFVLTKKGYYRASLSVVLESGKTQEINPQLESVYRTVEINAVPSKVESSTIPRRKPMWGAQLDMTRNAFQNVPVRFTSKPEGIVFTFRVKNLLQEDVVFGYQKYVAGRVFGKEGVHIIDDKGAKFYPKNYWYSETGARFYSIGSLFVSLGSSEAYGTVIPSGEEIELKIDFPPISAGAKEIQFVSPTVFMLQEQWSWKGFRVFHSDYDL